MSQGSVAKMAALAAALCGAAFGQLNQNCTVSVLNRTVIANADGSWVLPNIPANFGPVKARATCVQNGLTTFGESAFFTVPANNAVNLPDIRLGNTTPIPVSLSITPGSPSLTAIGQTIQLSVAAVYPSGSSANVTSDPGTTYTTSNAGIASISATGLVTAVSSGTVVIQSSNDGATAIVSARVLLAGNDSDSDGIPDDVETQLGMGPKNAIDAQEDFDRDGLTNLREYQLGTDLRKADTDGDGLQDGDEVTRGTNPLIRDTDGDGISDGLEVQSGSNPLNPNSYNLGSLLSSIIVTPPTAALVVNSINPTASVQLAIQGRLIDNSTLDLTSTSRGTNYASSNLQVCSFGSPDGKVFGGSSGTCTVTVTNSGFQAQVAITVSNFQPHPVSSIALPGATAVDVSGNFAYVAAGGSGLHVVNITNRSTPQLIRTVALAGSATDVRLSGNFAYVAAGSAGLHVVDVSTPSLASRIATIDTPGSASDVAVRGGFAYVADGGPGLQVIDVGNPSSPTLVGSVSLGTSAIGVDVDPLRQVAAVALGTGGLRLVDVSNKVVPVLRGLLSGGNVQDVVVKGTAAFLADYSRSFSAVDLTNANSPVLTASVPPQFGGFLYDVFYAGNFAFGADEFFVNGTPVIDITQPLAPASRTILSFPGDATGTGISADSSYVFLVAGGVLNIGQYQEIIDNGGVPPAIQITSPLSGPLIQGSIITVSANATDDVAIVSATLTVNEMPVFMASAPPYSVTYTVPAAATSLTFGATAIDYGNNVGTATSVTLPVIPDPLTSARGRVIGTNGTPVSGATVSALGKSGISLADGSFELTGLSTIRGPIAVTAVVTQAGTLLGGVSASIQAVLGGITQIGDIRVGPKPFITSLNPASALAGTSPQIALSGANLSASTFAFVPSGITVTSSSIGGTGTSATLNVAIGANVSGEIVLVATNPAGSSDATPVLGFVRSATSFNTLVVPGSSPTADPDKDGLTNQQEITAGTNPLAGDTDADQAIDGLEVTLGSDPRDPNSLPTPSISGWVSSRITSILNLQNPSIGLPGSTQFVSGRTFSVLNSQNPSIGLPGSTQFVSGRTFSMLNDQNPSIGLPGSTQFVSGRTFSVLNSQNPSIGLPGSTQFVSGRTFSMLNGQNPSIGLPGSTQFVSGRTFSMLNGYSPRCPAKPPNPE